MVIAALQPTDESNCQSGDSLMSSGIFCIQPADGPAHGLHVAEDVGVEPRAAGDSGYLSRAGAMSNRVSGIGPLALKRSIWKTHMSSRWPAAVEYVLQRRVGNETAVPIGLSVDHHRRKPWWQRAAGHDVLGPDLLSARCRNTSCFRSQTCTAPTLKPDLAGIELIEIDQLLQRRLEAVPCRKRRSLRASQAA